MLIAVPDCHCTPQRKLPRFRMILKRCSKSDCNGSDNDDDDDGDDGDGGCGNDDKDDDDNNSNDDEDAAAAADGDNSNSDNDVMIMMMMTTARVIIIIMITMALKGAILGPHNLLVVSQTDGCVQDSRAIAYNNTPIKD